MAKYEVWVKTEVALVCEADSLEEAKEVLVDALSGFEVTAENVDGSEIEPDEDNYDEDEDETEDEEIQDPLGT